MRLLLFGWKEKRSALQMFLTRERRLARVLLEKATAAQSV
jgi:hypothetical protein